MKFRDMVDAVLVHFNDAVDPDDGGNKTLRERIWLRGQEVAQDFWDEHEWEFKYKESTDLTLASGSDTMTTPADYHSEGYEGGLWIPQQNSRILFERVQEMYRRKKEVLNTGISGRPDYYTIVQLDPTSLTPTFVFERPADQNYTLRVVYQIKAPIVADRPPVLVAALAAGTSLGVGVYQYRCTYVTAEGETDGGLITSITTTTNNQVVSLTGIPLAPSWSLVTSRKIYRTTVGGASFLLLTTLSDNSTTTFTDNTVDGSLGAALATPGYSGLEKIPVEYHVSVLQEGIIALDARDKGDMRSGAEHEARYRKRIARAWDNRQIGRDRNMRIGDEGLIKFRMH
jgi:hypothetical protein